MTHIELKMTTDNGVDYTIDVEYEHLYERSVYNYGDGSGYPGYDSIEIKTISFKGKDVTNLNWDFEKIEERISELN